MKAYYNNLLLGEFGYPSFNYCILNSNNKILFVSDDLNRLIDIFNEFKSLYFNDSFIIEVLWRD